MNPDWEEGEDASSYTCSRLDDQGEVVSVTQYSYGTDPELGRVLRSIVTTQGDEVTSRQMFTYGSDVAAGTTYVERRTLRRADGLDTSEYRKYVYDSSHRMITMTQSKDADAPYASFAYDEDGSLLSVNCTYPGEGAKAESVFTYERDLDGTILTMTWKCLDDEVYAAQNPVTGGITIGDVYEVEPGNSLLFTYYYDEVPASAE